MSTPTRPDAAVRARAPLGVAPTIDGAEALRAGRWSIRTTRRRVVVALVLVVALLAGAWIALTTGTIELRPDEILGALLGDGTGRASRVVWGIRVPRLVAAFAVGACLALSGAVFQNLTGNPLGSPDVIGFVTGSATGAIIAIVAFTAGPLAVAASAVGGGLLAAALVVGLAHLRDRGAPSTGGGYRLVLVGIGASAFFGAVNDLLLTRSQADAAVAAQQWLVGTLNSRDPFIVWLCLGIAVVATPLVLALGQRMAALQLGDAVATQAGVPVAATRLLLTLLGVILVAAATATAGPVSFVALAAPQVAWRLVGRGRPALICTALMGAVLVLAADLASQHLPWGLAMPVGLVTGLLGGVYLLVLLTRGNR